MCHAQAALLRGFRPQLHSPSSSSSKLVTKVCSRRCIYCDIWKLATVVSTHVPLTSRYNITPKPTTSNTSFSPRSAAPNAQTRPALLRQAEVQIESGLSTQRARLASIMSICVVEGAGQSEGLRIAHDRCFEAIQSLLYEEALIEEDLVFSNAYTQRRSSGDSYSTSPVSSSPQHSCAVAQSYYTAERRPSYAGMAM